MIDIQDFGSQQITIKYTITHGTESAAFIVNIDRPNMNISLPKRKTHPRWTRLEFNQCPNCPLDVKKHPHCPAALGIVDLIKFFSGSTSWKEVDVKVETNERTYFKHTVLQQAASSLLGLCLATSECPILGMLRPMARFHLPFQTIEESTYRAISMYLLGQFYLNTHKMETDWELKHLSRLYENIKLVNRTFHTRLSHLEIEDASLNALVNLDVFAKYVLFEIDENYIYELENLFKVYFREDWRKKKL